jgi:hypothetical protein
LVAALILAIVISVIVVVVGVVDFAAFRHRHPRALLLELVGFAGIIVLAFWSNGVAALAKAVGIGRGVDLVIYPLMIWLFREAVLGRVRYHRQQKLITDLTRQLAVVESRVTWPSTDDEASVEREHADAG